MRFTAAALALTVAVALPLGARALDEVRLGAVDPFRLTVNTASSTVFTVQGSGFEDVGHPQRAQYMHWQVRRDDGGWQICDSSQTSGVRLCTETGWTPVLATMQVGPYWTQRAGFVELRVWRGLGPVDASDPAQGAATHTGWSNVVRIPVVTPGGAAPAIRSVSKQQFPLKGDDAAYEFSIDAANVDRSTAIVYRGDVVVFPRRLDEGHLVLTAVPPVYRRSTPGELPLQVRTDRGGLSNVVYIRFAAPTTPVSVKAGTPLLRTGQVARPAQGGSAVVAGALAPLRATVVCATAPLYRDAGGTTPLQVGGEARSLSRTAEVTLTARPAGPFTAIRLALTPGAPPAPAFVSSACLHVL